MPSAGVRVVPGERKRGMERLRGGQSLTQTEESLCWCGDITTGVDWHDHDGSVAGSGLRDTEGSGLKE